MRSAYNFFSRDYFSRHSTNTTNQGTLQNSAEQWKALSEEERQKFELLAEKDKERYKADLEVYSAKFRKHGIEPMLSKRGWIWVCFSPPEKQAYLYNCVNHGKARELASFLLLLNVTPSNPSHDPERKHRPHAGLRRSCHSVASTTQHGGPHDFSRRAGGSADA